MKNTLFWNLYTAWTQGGSDEIYRDRNECLAWLKIAKAIGEEDVAEMSDNDLEKLATAICEEYEEEMAYGI